MALKVALVAVAALVLAGTASAKRITAHAGVVRATVSWQSAEYYQAKHVGLRIARDGKTVLRRVLGYPVPQELRVRDLDGDGEPEVIADFYTGGAHCCTLSRTYRYEGSTYSVLKHDWGSEPYRLEDLVRDGIPELVSSDGRFDYVFAPYAGSGRPLRIWRYRAGRMLDVTRSFPSLIRKDAASFWKFYRGEPATARGMLAAWLADEYLLGRRAQAWATMRRLNRSGAFRPYPEGDSWPGGRAYLRALHRYLVKLGYARKS
jgi:hypothetical protein